MRNLFFAFLLVFVPVSLSAQDDPAAAIQQTIESQFHAFGEGDFDRAFEFASPNIQGFFRNANNFRTMVERGYPMVIGPDTVEFLPLRKEAGLLLQRVVIRDSKGALHVLDYQMIPGARGWLINGVNLLAETGASA